MVVGDVMVKKPYTIVKTASLKKAQELVVENSIRHLPVVDDNDRPIGVISVRDILRFLCVQFAELRTAD